MPMAKAVKNETSQTSVAVGQNDKPSQSFAKAGAGPANTRDVKLHGRVLIAEDSPTNQALARLLLNKMGLETVIVENGELAIQKIMNENFDVVFMDIQMPVMNGYEATRLLREKGFKRPIIALTACAMKGDDEKCFAAGCSDYLSKPIDRKKLVDTLLKYFSVTSTNCPDTIANAKEKSMETVKQQELAECSGSPEIEIDWHLLMERIGSEELVDEIIPIFIKDNIQRMQMLSQAVEKNDINEVKFYAHSLKGASGTVGATKLSELGRQLENDARNSDDSNFKPVFKEMSERFSRLIDFLAKSDWKQIAQQASSEHQAGKS
jgi:CheY-like chemotaxis protein